MSALLLWVDVAIKNYEQIRSRRDLEPEPPCQERRQARDLETRRPRVYGTWFK
ncbi:MAG: hypothetical protein R2932_20435 [Caldilineaceae bacterium]